MLCAAKDLRALARCGIVPCEHIACALCAFRIGYTAGVAAFGSGRTVYPDLIQIAKLIFIVAASRYAALEFIHHAHSFRIFVPHILRSAVFFPGSARFIPRKIRRNA